MKIGQSKFINKDQHTIDYVFFEGLATFKNGIITEDIGSDDPIFERFTIGVEERSWTILVWDDNYVLISINAQSIPEYVLDRVSLNLTIKDRELLEEIRDISIATGVISDLSK